MADSRLLKPAAWSLAEQRSRERNAPRHDVAPVAAHSYRAKVLRMAITQKISVAMGRDELRLAKTAADEEGLSLSAFVTRAVRERLEERRRMEAAREVLATFALEELPTPTERRDLVELWTRARGTAVRAAKPRRAARKRRSRAR